VISAMLRLQFTAVSSVIVAAGCRLSRYGDVIAEKTGLSGSWIGRCSPPGTGDGDRFGGRRP
jgi:cation:H+ antiporter